MKTSTILLATATALVAGVQGRRCQNITVPVTISARNGVFNLTTPVTNIDVNNFILDLSAQGGNYTQKILTSYATVSGTFQLATTYCEPDNGCSGNLVQLLTHGIGFDRSYWDIPFNNYNYSYVNRALDCGYATFSWDRLGIGMSQHGEPTNQIQSWLEIQALRALTMKLREGGIPGISKKFAKVVHVGHSFGSVESYALAAYYPTISDGIVLTGFSQNGSFIPFFALGADFVQANKNPALTSYANGYLAPAVATGVQTNFFGPGDFDPNILQFATATGQPVTTGELLTIGGTSAVTSNFTGPCLIITGERDIPFCGGNCLATGGTGPSIPAKARATLPKVRNFTSAIVKGAGHGLNLQYSHVQTYNTILGYLESNGLGA